MQDQDDHKESEMVTFLPVEKFNEIKPAFSVVSIFPSDSYLWHYIMGVLWKDLHLRILVWFK